MTGQNGHYYGDLAFQDKENCICYLVRSVIVAYVHVLTDHVDYSTRVLVDCLTEDFMSPHNWLMYFKS